MSDKLQVADDSSSGFARSIITSLRVGVGVGRPSTHWYYAQEVSQATYFPPASVALNYSDIIANRPTHDRCTAYKIRIIRAEIGSIWLVPGIPPRTREEAVRSETPIFAESMY